MKSNFKDFFLAISIIMSLSGAVNSGWAYFYPVIPFMFYVLWYTKLKYGKRSFILATIFIIFCITISLTRDRNPLLYPVLNGGVITVNKDIINNALPILKGDYPVTYIEHTGDGWNPDEVYAHATATIFYSKYDLESELYEKSIDPNFSYYKSINKPIQSKWSEYLGNLTFLPFGFLGLIAVMAIVITS